MRTVHLAETVLAETAWPALGARLEVGSAGAHGATSAYSALFCPR